MTGNNPKKIKRVKKQLYDYIASRAENFTKPKSLKDKIIHFFCLPYVYIGLMLLITFVAVYLCMGVIVFEKGNILYPILWLSGFSVLIFNVAYVLVVSLYSLMVTPKTIREKKISYIPSTAIVYPVKNEATGLFERINYTLENNNLKNITLCFLSDSDKESLLYENEVINRLRRKFGNDKIYYWHRKKPTEKKQGNISGWLRSHYKEYKYFMVCDADSMVPKNMLLKLLQKAEHPANQEIAIFQSRLHIAHAKTPFAKYQAISARLAQKLYMRTNQTVFGRSVSFGHGNLIRSNVFVRVKVPKGVLSHDIWDTIALDKMGYKVAFCYDVITYEEVPANYLEMRARDRRWSKGTLQTWPLLFSSNISIPTRFYCAYGLYMYLSQPVFFAWIALSFLASSITVGKLLSFQRFALLGATFVDLELTSMLFGVLIIVFFHKLLLCRSPKDVWDVIKEIGFSTLICLNNVYYTTQDIITMPFRSIKKWRPMSKNPFEHLTLAKTFINLWPSTLLGLLALYFGIKYSSQWALAASPFIASFILVIPLSYLTARSN
jgi:membrane glycosyltransferase